MKIVTPICGNTVVIAYQAENNRTQVRFDLSDIVREFPGGTAALVIRRHGDTDPVPAASAVMDGTALVWTVNAWECAKKGFLHAQVIYSAGDTVAKTKIYRFDVADSITATAEEPDGWQDWVGQLTEAAAEVVEAVESYDAITAEATGLAAGESPTAEIDRTGDNPVLKLGIPAGATGAKGDKGDTGAKGDKGDTGATGAQGPKGDKGDKGDTGSQGPAGPKGDPGDPGDIIDDTAGAGDTDKTFSADKLTAMNSSLLNAINVLQPTATSGDVGKFLKAKTVADGKVTEYEFGSGGGGGSVNDVQINGTSILSQGVANIPVASTSTAGAAKASLTGGTSALSDGTIIINATNWLQLKKGTNGYNPVVPSNTPSAVFYGLARAAGDTTQYSQTSDSVNSMPNYTESAKSSISEMLNGAVSVSGTTPSITAKAGVRYICGEVSTLTIVVPSTGIIDVTFDSGSTPTVLTVTPPTGMTMRWIGDDPTALEANKHYEVNIMDGCNGMVVSWT